MVNGQQTETATKTKTEIETETETEMEAEAEAEAETGTGTKIEREKETETETEAGTGTGTGTGVGVLTGDGVGVRGTGLFANLIAFTKLAIIFRHLYDESLVITIYSSLYDKLYIHKRFISRPMPPFFQALRMFPKVEISG